MSETRPYKARYRLKNWPEYNSALGRRADLSVWMAPDVLENWAGSGHKLYSDMAIDAALMLRAVFRLPLRQTVGMVRSIFQMLGVDLPVPSYSTLSRRSKFSAIRQPEPGPNLSNTHRDVVIDSSGFRLHGSSHTMKREDKQRSRKGWRKLHIIVDADTGEILADELTNPDIHDSDMTLDLADRIPNPISRLYGDGAYNCNYVRSRLEERHQPLPRAKGIFPPTRTEILSKLPSDITSQRGQQIDLIRRRGWRTWRRLNDAGKREAVETAFARLKRTFGYRLRSRTEETLKGEARRMVHALNIRTSLGMPDAEKI